MFIKLEYQIVALDQSELGLHYFQKPFEILKQLILYYFFYLFFQTGTCALFFAAQGGFLDIVKLLVDHGVPVDIPSYVSHHLKNPHKERISNQLRSYFRLIPKYSHGALLTFKTIC